MDGAHALSMPVSSTLRFRRGGRPVLWFCLALCSLLISTHCTSASEAPAPPAVDPDQYMVLEYMWSFPKPEDIRAGILRTLSRSHSTQPRVSIENSVPALKSVEEIASAAYGEDEMGAGLMNKLKQIAPPVLGAASAAALTVFAKSKVVDLLSKEPPARKTEEVTELKAAPPAPAPPSAPEKAVEVAPKTEAPPPKVDVEQPKTEAPAVEKMAAAAAPAEKSGGAAEKDKGPALSEAAQKIGGAAAAAAAEEATKAAAATVAAGAKEVKGAVKDAVKEVKEAKEEVKKEAKEEVKAAKEAGGGGGGGAAFAMAPAVLGRSLWRGLGQGLGGGKRGAVCGLRPRSAAGAAAPCRRNAARFVRAAVSDEENVQEPAGFEKFFAGLFGSIGAAPEQVGLARFDRSKFPELYPATLTEFAELLPTDSPEMCIFRPLLAQTSLEQRELQLVFDANRDGWEAAAFHRAVDKLGPGVVLARTEGGAILGGYNPKGWVGYGEYRGSIAAFLFTYPDGDLSQPAIKLRKVGGSSLACIDDPESGPRFGADGFHVPLLDSSPYYERRTDGSNTVFAPGEPMTGTPLTDLKVFVGVYGPDEEIPFNDALPIQLE